jgi:hypothetical protein
MDFTNNNSKNGDDDDNDNNFTTIKGDCNNTFQRSQEKHQ